MSLRITKVKIILIKITTKHYQILKGLKLHKLIKKIKILTLFKGKIQMGIILNRIQLEG